MFIELHSKTLEKDIEVEVEYRFYKGRPAIIRACPGDSSPPEPAERDFVSIKCVESGRELVNVLCEDDIDEINRRLDNYFEERSHY